jgi:hypothetical protein
VILDARGPRSCGRNSEDDYKLHKKVGQAMADFFVSYTSIDRVWAFWIAQVLMDLGHEAHVHEWEISAGGNIAAWMEKRHREADHILCVISAIYLTKDYSSWERQAAQWAAASKRPNFALPVFVQDCEAPTLLAPFKRCDLFGLSEDDARNTLAEYLEPAKAPLIPVQFPGDERNTQPAPAGLDPIVFPGGALVSASTPFRPARHSVDQIELQERVESSSGSLAAQRSDVSFLSKPVVFISYSHADEPDKPADGETKWLSFVTSFLKVAERRGVIEIWTDKMLPEWSSETERKLRMCDIFLLLISPNSVSSDNFIQKALELVRERRSKGQEIHFYPLLLTPTPSIGLDTLRGENLRPRDGRALSSLLFDDRRLQMADFANDIEAIARKISLRKSLSLPTPPRDNGRLAPLGEIHDRQSLENWLKGKSNEVAVAIAGRAALRVAPVALYATERPLNDLGMKALADLAGAIFRATAIARVVAKYPIQTSRLGAAAVAAGRAVGVAADLAVGRAVGTAIPVGNAIPSAVRDSNFDIVRVVNLVTGAASASKAAAFAAYAVKYPLDAGVTAIMQFVEAAADVRTSAVVTAVSLYALNSDSAEDIRAIASARVAASANRMAWAEVMSDVHAVQKHGIEALIDSPLWANNSAPDWATDSWVGLQVALPSGDNWDVWFEWYEERLRGGSRGDAHELAFANVPLDVWNHGPAGANAWVSEELLRRVAA